MISKRIAAVLMAMCCAGAHAGTQTGTVTQVNVRSTDGLVYVYLSGTASGRVTCASATAYWIIKDETSTSGKQQIAELMLASATGKTVTITGTNSCQRWLDGEDIGLVSVS
jgi:hypothetical protein